MKIRMARNVTAQTPVLWIEHYRILNFLSMIIGNREFDLINRTYIMGILNVTPDSFSDGGNNKTVETALQHTNEMIIEGADIIDLGGESTRPGADHVSEAEEINRVIPVLKAIKARWDIPVSVDTYKAGTAAAALEEGADLINDVWGLRYDKGEMAEVVAASHKPYVLMHNTRNDKSPDFITNLKTSLEESLKIAHSAGIYKDMIILDPGIGFNKSYKENLEILNRLGELKEMGYPLLLGCSRKSVIGNALNLPVNERLEGTLVTTVLAAMAGYSFVRVHDVKENKRVLDMYKCIDCFDC